MFQRTQVAEVHSRVTLSHTADAVHALGVNADCLVYDALQAAAIHICCLLGDFQYERLLAVSPCVFVVVNGNDRMPHEWQLKEGEDVLDTLPSHWVVCGIVEIQRLYRIHSAWRNDVIPVRRRK